MEIRKDLQSAEALLNRLLEYSTKLLNFNREDWVHYKNGEDFEKIYKQPYDNQIILEQIYNQGKDFAYTLGMHLQEFNDVKLYETLSRELPIFCFVVNSIYLRSSSFSINILIYFIIYQLLISPRKMA